VLSNKLVVYDLENMEIGWADFNCEFPTNLFQLLSFIISLVFRLKFVDTDVYIE
jgi:hypothetical protein